MKYKEPDFKKFVTTPNDSIKAILIYGGDRGSVLEHYKVVSEALVSNTEDPFLVSNLENDNIKDEPSILIDEAKAISFMGDRKLIRIKDAADNISDTVADTVRDMDTKSAFLLLTSDNLKPSSKLRKFFENSKEAAVLPCYLDDGRGIANIINDICRNENVRITPDALNYLVDNLGEDRNITRMEIEKLILFTIEEKLIDLEAVKKVISNSSALSFNDLTYSIAEGNISKALLTYDRLILEGNYPIILLRSILNHFKILYFSKLQIESNKANIDSVIKSMKPPVFFKNVPSMKKQLLKWNSSRLLKAIEYINDIDIQCKTTGSPVLEIMGHCILSLLKLAG